MSDERLHQDELVSAYLDGEATPAEIAEIEASDALLARVEELRAVRDAVAAVVAPLPADRQDDLIGAALGVADAEAAARVEAKVVPMRHPQRLLLAMAAAVVVLAAIVGTGLIASRGGDESEQFASVASTVDDAAPAEMAAEEPMAEAAPAAEEEPMAEMDMEAAAEAMAEMDMEAAAGEPMAEEAMAAADEPVAEEATAAAEQAAEAAMAAAEEDAAPTTATAATSTADARLDAEEQELSGSAADEAEPGEEAQLAPVADLGALETLEELFESIGASWSAALEDGAVADPGACSSAVNERALELSAETLHSFVASVGVEDPVGVDGRFARRADGTSFIAYASPPDCAVGVRELPGS